MQKSNTPVCEIDYKTHLAEIQPYDSGTPKINTPAFYGASPGKDFLYLIPTVGERPLYFSISGLPDGLELNAADGIIHGKSAVSGEFKLLISVENRLGRTEKEFTLVIKENALALTPPMGWNSWNCYRAQIDDTKIRSVADAMINSGLAARGYSYVNLDSGWQSPERGGKFNSIIPIPEFPDMKALCDYIHSKGLKIGIYSTPYEVPWGCEGAGGSSGQIDSSWPTKFGKYIGLRKFEKEDVAQWSEWGFDYLKYDWFHTDMYHAERMANELRKSPRDFIYSLVTCVNIKDAEKVKKLAHMWRDNADTHPGWQSVLDNSMNTEIWNEHISPGHWFDLDMTAILPRDGKVLSENEQIFCITRWMMQSSPILLDCHPGELTEFQKKLLSNEDIIAINQDPLGKPPISIYRDSKWDIQLKPLADGNVAVAYYNMSTLPAIAPYIGIFAWVGYDFEARDLWQQKDLGRIDDDYVIGVEGHCAKVFKLFCPPNPCKVLRE